MEELIWARVGLAIAVMAAGSISDWRTRTASDSFWYVLGIGGALLLGLDMFMDGASLTSLVCLVLITLVFMDLLWDRPGIFEDGINPLPLVLYALTVVAYAYMTVTEYGEGYYWTMLTIPVLIALFFLLYQFDIIKGGADAKAMMALSFCFATYPALDGLPLLQLAYPEAQEFLTFPVLLLFNGALLTLIMPIGMFFINLVRRDLRFPLMFLGLRMDIDEAPSKHVWPMEKVVDGEIKTSVFKQDDDDEANWGALRARGVDRPWVTPKVPFLIPLTFAVPFSFVVGNLIFYLMGI